MEAIVQAMYRLRLLMLARQDCNRGTHHGNAWCQHHSLHSCPQQVAEGCKADVSIACGFTNGVELIHQLVGHDVRSGLATLKTSKG